MDDMTDSEQRYTLAEARAILGGQVCAAEGHDLETVCNGAGEPVQLACTRCGRVWSVHREVLRDGS